MKKIITSALLCLSFMSFAQQKELTLKDAIRYALENKADAEKARLEVTKSEYKILILMPAHLLSRVCPQVMSL